jgi:hypothetical protein
MQNAREVSLGSRAANGPSGTMVGVVQLETRVEGAWLQRLKLNYKKKLTAALNLKLRPYCLEDMPSIATMKKLSSGSASTGILLDTAGGSTHGGAGLLAAGQGLHSSTFQLNMSCSLSLPPPTEPSYPTKRAYVEPSSG